MNARFQKLHNDLFWEIYDSKNEKRIVWQGYNDDYWWNNVANSDQFQIRGEYRLDPSTNTVSLLTPLAVDGELPCLACGGEVGHRINCPHGIAFSSFTATKA